MSNSMFIALGAISAALVLTPLVILGSLIMVLACAVAI